jgi:hypothetical protein
MAFIRTLLRPVFGSWKTLAHFWVVPLYTSFKAVYIEIAMIAGPQYLSLLASSSVEK